jgi:hypothetical protein
MKINTKSLLMMTVLNSTACFSDPIDGTWTLDDSDEGCVTETNLNDGISYSYEGCLSFDEFEFSVLEGTPSDGEGVLAYSYSYSGGGDSGFYSDSIDIELEDIEIVDNSPNYKISFDMDNDGDALPLELDCTLSGAVLDCEAEIDIEDDSVLKFDIKLKKSDS